ncbi:MAG: TolC family protein [Bacteroidales bacterium]|nr:TolC family protein [Bacteroidales bacterium]
MKKFVITAGFILLIFSNITAQESSDKKYFTLEECLQYAESNNFSLQSANINISSSELNLKQAKENIAPTVSASASQSFNFGNYEKSVGWGGNYGINAGMTLFNGLSNANKIKQSKLNVEQSQLQLESSKNNIRVSIIQAFLAIMMNEDMLEYQQQVLTASKEQMDQGKQQLDVGQILESDYKMLQAQYTSDLYNIENTKHNIQSNYLTLKNLLSIDPAKEIVISRPDSTTLFKNLELPALQELIDRSTNYLPELKMSENEIASAEYDVKIQKAGFSPTLSANAGISTGYNGSNLTSPNTGWGTQLWHGLGENIGLSLNIPIYQRSTVRNNVKQAQYRAEQIELENKETLYKVHRDLQQSYLDVATAQNEFIAAEAKKDAYLANYKTYKLRFQYGSVTAVDLIQQQTNFLNQLHQFMQAKYSYVLKRKILDVYMGIPVTL